MLEPPTRLPPDETERGVLVVGATDLGVTDDGAGRPTCGREGWGVYVGVTDRGVGFEVETRDGDPPEREALPEEEGFDRTGEGL